MSRAAREEMLEELAIAEQDEQLAEEFRDAWLACAPEEPSW